MVPMSMAVAAAASGSVLTGAILEYLNFLIGLVVIISIIMILSMVGGVGSQDSRRWQQG